METPKALADTIGTKRILAHLFHGQLTGTNYSHAYWHGPPDNRRDFFRTTMPASYVGYSIEPYTGGYVPTSLGLADMDVPSSGGQADSTSDMLLIAKNLLPLLQLGCTKCWVDAFASDYETDRESLLANLHTHLDTLGAPSRTIGTEAVPVTQNGSRLDIDDTLISERPYLMLEWNYKLAFDYDERWSVDPDTTEVHIIVDGSGAQDAARAATTGYTSALAMTETNGPHYLDRLADAGFIVGTNAAGTNSWIADWIKSRYAPTSTSNL